MPSTPPFTLSRRLLLGLGVSLLTMPAAAATSTPTVQRFASFDGLQIAWREIGQGRPTLCVHGFMGNAQGNWIDNGYAAAIAATGRRVIMPDLRGHGQSEAPEDAARYPKDALPMDQEALLAHLAIEDYDLVGYSLGARTAVRMVDRGAKPGKLVLGGMGGSGITQVNIRQAYFEDLIRNGPNAKDPRAGAFVQAFLERNGVKAAVALNVLGTQLSTSEEQLALFATPTLVVSGVDDQDNGSVEGLAALIPGAKGVRTIGNHLSALQDASLRDAITGFLGQA